MEEQGPFLIDWRTLFGKAPFELRKQCIRGHLRNSHLRSIVWRLLLGVLPMEDRTQWVEVIGQERRNYTELRHRIESNPRINNSPEGKNFDGNNPLSLNAEVWCFVNTGEMKFQSPWCRHFENQSTMKNIEKDVDRTCPDLKFFQIDDVKQTMVNVLFFYSKLNSQISYIQGMHELLGPILFVLDSDQKAFQDMKEQDILRPNGSDFSDVDVHCLAVLNDPVFLEHDAFALFTRLMSLIRCFYLSDNAPLVNANVATFKSHLEREPFSESLSGKSSELLRRLDYICNGLLLEVDPPLHHHLSNLDILPQIYGVRWLRLLFGREFSLPDLLYLWDVIFAECHQQQSLEIVDCIFVALLVQIRIVLLNGDYSACIHCLMRYPPIVDIQTFIHYVLHLVAPKKFCGSLENVHKAYQTHLTLAGKTHPNRSKSPPIHPTRSRQLENVFSKIGRQALTSAQQIHFSSLTRKEHKGQESLVKEGQFSTEFASTKNIEVKQQPNAAQYADEIELMKEQIAQLQSRLNDSDLLKQICTQNITSLVKELEKTGPFAEEQTKKINKIREIAEQLNRSSVPEQLIPRYLHALPSTSATNSTTGETGPIEVASELLGLRPSTPSETVARSRLSSKSLNNSNELIELRFDRKKNF
ncbi:hypothetical protein niasHS_013497 [Heterodera schachtii]|uniref:Rab-GAP TBC domain-containing protein n=1 Tax=Heterodera schachtii TaxID=97005 RepID=A0ABD2IBQ2_HETSC